MIRRLLAIVGAAIIAWIGVAPPVMSTPASTFTPIATYTYDGPHNVADFRSVVTRRGPLSSYVRETTTNDVDHSPHGSPARLAEPTPRSTYNYDGRRQIVQVASVSLTGGTPAPRLWGEICIFGPSRVAANAGSGALRGVDEVLSGLPKGNQSWVRMVPDESTLTAKFSELTEGGTPTTWKNFNGTVIERSDGVQVGMRSSSRSGGGAIDIRMPDGSRIRIHVEQP